MESLDYWKFCEELTVVQAALLIVGVDPSTTSWSTGGPISSVRPQGYDAVLAALSNSIKAGRLSARLRSPARESGYVRYPQDNEMVSKDQRGVEIIFRCEPDWFLTTISVDDLKNWLQARGFTPEHFFPDRTGTVPEYLDPKAEHYAPKLAAAVSAWQAVTANPKATKGRSAKRAITNWLTSNASRFGLIKSDGSPNELGIEEIAKVANWDSKGGAPKTPTTNSPTDGTPHDCEAQEPSGP